MKLKKSNKSMPQMVITHATKPPLTRDEADELSDALFELANAVPNGVEAFITIKPLNRSAITWNSSDLLSSGVPIMFEH